jgi:hypothetical protein
MNNNELREELNDAVACTPAEIEDIILVVNRHTASNRELLKECLIIIKGFKEEFSLDALMNNSSLSYLIELIQKIEQEITK